MSNMNPTIQQKILEVYQKNVNRIDDYLEHGYRNDDKETMRATILLFIGSITEEFLNYRYNGEGKDIPASVPSESTSSNDGVEKMKANILKLVDEMKKEYDQYDGIEVMAYITWLKQIAGVQWSEMYQKGFDNIAVSFAYIPDFKNAKEKEDFERGMKDAIAKKKSC